MNKAFLYKVAGILILTLLMTWAITYVNEIILERQTRHSEVKNQIAKNSAGTQTLTGPVLVIPYVEEYPVKIGEGKDEKIVTQSVSGYVYLLPKDLQLSGGFTNEYKKLGIYKALMYQLGGIIKGEFKIPAQLNLKSDHEQGVFRFKPAYLSIGISDARGVYGNPTLSWSGQPLNFSQGSQLNTLGNGIHAKLGHLEVSNDQNILFEIKLNLRGMETFSFVPIAESNSITLKSNWQHPHFNGSFLPDAASQKVDANGFSAKWAVSSLSSSNQDNLIRKLNGESTISLEPLSIGFVEPINVYSQADRATKYGLLFISLTFAGFFVFETLKQLRIHPAQYTLVGLSMSLFYLLLVSMAEHIGFALAYVSASLACVSLLAYYLSYVLKSKINGIFFAGLLTALYGALYAILASEDNALLMGSLLVFGLLAVTMIVTRKIDWYQIGETKQLIN